MQINDPDSITFLSNGIFEVSSSLRKIMPETGIVGGMTRKIIIRD